MFYLVDCHSIPLHSIVGGGNANKHSPTSPRRLKNLPVEAFASHVSRKALDFHFPLPLEFRVSLPTGRRAGMFRGKFHPQVSARCQENAREIKFNFRQFLMDYANNSSIHGIKYVFSERKNCFTR